MDRLHGVNEERIGLGYGLAAYLLWGLFPLYFTLFARSGAVEVVAHPEARRDTTMSASHCIFMLPISPP